MKKELKGFVLGLIIATLLMGTVFAGGVKQTIDVVLNSVNLTVNGKKIAADNILYNGTTYVPLRAVAEALGKDVDWDQSTNTANINDKDSNKVAPKVEKDKNKPLETSESEIGKFSIFKRNEKVNAVQTSGPFTVKVGKMQVATLDVLKDYKSTFNNKDKVTILVLEVEVENKSKDTNTIHPDQGIVVTNTKEQKEAEMLLSDNIGGDYIGEVIKKGNVMFVLDSDANEIENFKYTISAPFDSNYDSLGEDIVFNLTF